MIDLGCSGLARKRGSLDRWPIAAHAKAIPEVAANSSVTVRLLSAWRTFVNVN